MRFDELPLVVLHKGRAAPSSGTGMSEPSLVPTPTVKMRKLPFCARGGCTACSSRSSPSVKRMSARWLLSPLPNASAAARMAAVISVPPRGNGVRIQVRDGGEHRRVVDGQGSLHKGRAREGDEAHAVAAQRIEQILRGEFRAREAVGLHIGGEHALRGVDGDHDIEPLPLAFLRRSRPSAAG